MSSKRPPREERRRQLLDAAVECIRHDGAGVSMEQLAAAGGVTKPILYRHFGDREGLMATLGAEFAAELMASISASLGADAGPRELLDSTIDSFVSFIERDPELYRFLIQQATIRPEGVDAVAGLIESISDQVAVVLGQQLRDNGRDDTPSELWAHGIVGMVREAANRWLEQPRLSRVELVTHLGDLLWHGLSGASVADT